ncbi:HEAT repeat domain-containing protein [Acidiferrobacter sp. SPIII_3]|jgi:hypothetical protein|uniref:HEAT repeat domain-containing protein n=1 Tax=Acidiferrobacter sp. SPIII_3 TaxID=1281578 RepID=UPI00197AD15A|nr:HEAT repeat domain-containing protein [Acidiferrobacter sp. SPIII_3]
MQRGDQASRGPPHVIGETHASMEIRSNPSAAPDFTRAYKALPLEQRLALALREHLSLDQRHLILHHEQWMQVRCYFARRADLAPDEIAILLEDQDHVIRLCVAKRPDLTSSQAARCTTDHNPNVRYAIARNPALSDDLRELLKADPDPLVRRAAAKGPRLPRITRRPGQAALIRS